MPPEFYFFLAFAVQGFVLAAALIRRGQKAAKHLGVWLIVLSLDMILSGLYSGEMYKEFPFLIGVRYGTPLLYGPLMWLYVRSLLSDFYPEYKKPLGRNLKLLLWAPFVVLKVWLLPMILEPGAQKIAFIDRYLNYQEPVYLLLDHVFAWFGLFFTLITIRLLSRYRHELGRAFSYRERVSLHWLWFMLFIQLGIWLLVWAFSLLNLFEFRIFIDRFVYFLAGLWIYAIGYFEFTTGVIFSGEFRKQAKETNKYSKTKLEPKRFQEIQQELGQLMNEQKPWLDNKLTLQELAQALKRPAYQISQVINDGFGQNLFSYVNSFRVAEAKAMLQDATYGEYTVLRIGLECGFNSKSSFNSVFKSICGQTPSEYRRQFSQK